MTVRRRAEVGKTRICTQKETNRKTSIAKMTEITFNFFYFIYDGMKEENLHFKNM